jgi:hypothetical protein
MAVNFAGTNAVDVTGAGNFIPELWSEEVLAAYKANLVMPQLVTTLDFHGEKGDTIHVPQPSRGSVTAKTGDNAVTLIAESNTSFDISINRHFEYSRLIEDIAKTQAMDSMRAFYTDDAGYALAIQVDTDLSSNGATFAASASTPTTAGTDYDEAVIGSDGTTQWTDNGSGNGAALTDAGVRRAIQYLDASNVPARNRAFCVSEVEKRKLLGLARFTEQAFVGEAGGANSIRNGLIGNVYGVPVYVSTNLPTDDANDSTTYDVALLFQKEAIVLVEQIGPRTQTQYQLPFLGDLFVADQVWGHGNMRPEAGISIVVPQ